MRTARGEASGDRRSFASIAGGVEGYLALALVALSYVVPRVDHPSDAEVIGRAAFFGVAFGLALGGTRFGEGGGRLAALVALGVLSLSLLAVLILVGVVRWEEVAWYWRWRWRWRR